MTQFRCIFAALAAIGAFALFTSADIVQPREQPELRLYTEQIEPAQGEEKLLLAAEPVLDMEYRIALARETEMPRDSPLVLAAQLRIITAAAIVVPAERYDC